MSVVKPSYSGAATAVTITLASLASAAYRQSTSIDNTTTLYLDVAITGKITTGSGTPGATPFVSIYAYGYDGTQFSNNATGSDAAFTPDNQANLGLLYTLATTVASTTYYLPYLQLAATMGWLWLPQKWGLIVLNSEGQPLSATAGNHVLEYQGINVTVN